jgi:hypothetical protein
MAFRLDAVQQAADFLIRLLSRSTSATLAVFLCQIVLKPGKPAATSCRLPKPTWCWLRPVRSEARVGLQMAVVLKSL